MLGLALIPLSFDQIRSPSQVTPPLVKAQSQMSTDNLPGTPSLEELRRFVAENPPPPEWFEGDEEDLFEA
jgi:hypothetical protein